MRLVNVAGVRLRRAAEEEEREPPPPPPPSHHSNHQFASMKNKFFNELTHLPSEHTLTDAHTQHTHLCIQFTQNTHRKAMQHTYTHMLLLHDNTGQGCLFQSYDDGRRNCAFKDTQTHSKSVYNLYVYLHCHIISMSNHPVISFSVSMCCFISLFCPLFSFLHVNTPLFSSRS